eukprot:CAMPEP_0206459678 /NCGR_PEP_ID=MMETSP0324_2-20121206/24315_1 /ASSEMBLY_ACC=CAM_ASM_000836 /TAXON_ID=2866 /ORGANISM="Crypthecodinium cohnii, Strain Seligo" /LENGTH=431 /DNA_ID=CAMNT_0053931267 /DNA_START=104 /DNA_END=1399 /DNA_ORIENTATION=-
MDVEDINNPEHPEDGPENAEAEEMDAALLNGETAEVEFDNDEPPESDGEGDMAEVDEEMDESEGEDDPNAVDDSVAKVTHKESVLGVAFWPADRRILMTGGQDDAAVLWTIQEDPNGGGLSCTERCRLNGHTDSVSQVAFSHDGKYAASSSLDGTVKIWNPETGDLVADLDGPSSEVEWILWHPKGHAILAGSGDTMAWMWWAPTGKLMQIFAGHGKTVTCGAWGLGGKLVVTASEDRSVMVWNPRDGSIVQNMHEVHESVIVSMSAHAEAPIVVTGSDDATAKILQIETGKALATLAGHEMSVEASGFNNPGQSGMSLLATASLDGKIQIWDGKSFDLRCSMKEEGGVVRFKWLQVAPFNAWLCTCATDGAIRIFDALAGRCVHTLQGHRRTIVDLDIALGDAGQLAVASGSEDKSCRIFTLTLGASASA